MSCYYSNQPLYFFCAHISSDGTVLISNVQISYFKQSIVLMENILFTVFF